MAIPNFKMIDWNDAQMDAAFLRAKAQPLDAFVNSGAHEIDLGAHTIFNDQRWKGFMPKGLPASEATDRLSLGFAKKLWKTKTGYGGETQYFGGAVATKHSIEELTLNRQTADLPPGRYVLIGYTDPIFENLFYDLLKPVSDDVILFRGYTGKFPTGRRGWTALLLRRYPFARLGIDDHELLYDRGAVPAEDDLLGTWRLDALFYQNQPMQIAELRFTRAARGRVTLDCDTTRGKAGLLLPKIVTDHFQTDALPSLRKELRTVDADYLAGKWTTDIHGPFAKLLLASSSGLFHPEKGGRGRRFSLYYLLTRRTGRR